VAADSQATVVVVLWERLSPMQRAGVLWLYGAYHGAHKPGYRGGILADGMGMGKTV
jgi:SNF2 family DNA or RNA helicase